VGVNGVGSRKGTRKRALIVPKATECGALCLNWGSRRAGVIKRRSVKIDLRQHREGVMVRESGETTGEGDSKFRR